MSTAMDRRDFVKMSAGALGAATLGCARHPKPMRESSRGIAQPNVLWLIAEDVCPEMACYGNPLVATPHLDGLAAGGVRFTHAFATAPVCSPARSAFNTGRHAIATGTHHHRSHRADGYRLPDGVRTVGDRLRERGYFVCNASYPQEGVFAPGKTDWNFTQETPFDGVDWRECPKGKPFFAQVNFFEAHRGFPWDDARINPDPVDPASVAVPPYYPDTPVVRQDIATYLTVINQLDAKVGQVLRRLEEDGLADNTLVFFFGDHGRAMIRGKQWLYEGGIHVPLIVHGPGVPAGVVSGRMTSLLDVTATTLAMAGGLPDDPLDGVPFLGPDAAEPDAVFAARDRCDETRDRIRCVRTRRFKYIRNYMPERPYTQPNAYIEGSYPVLGELKRLHAEGALTPEQSVFMVERKPDEELYDLDNDPHEVHNLAGAPAHAATLEDLRQRLDQWIAATGDQGAFPEPHSAVLLE